MFQGKPEGFHSVTMGSASPQDTSFPRTSPGMSVDSLPNVGMRIDDDIDDYGSDSRVI